MKKFLSFIFIAVLFVTPLYCGTVSYAKSDEIKKTEDDLYQMLKEQNLVTNGHSREDGVYQFTKTDKIDKNEYSTTTLNVLSSDPNFLNIVEEASITSLSATGSNYKQKYDNAVSNLAYSTVYYEETESNGNTYCTITKVTGGYVNKDSTCKVISQELRFGQASNNTSYSTTKTPTGKSWSYTAPSTWKPVRTNSTIGCYVSAIYTLTIQRYSTPWTLELDNYIYNSPGSIWP